MSQMSDEDRPYIESPSGTPRWVKVFGVIALVLVVLIGVMLVAGGEHGPGRHTLPVSVTEIHTPPVEHQGQQP